MRRQAAYKVRLAQRMRRDGWKAVTVWLDPESARAWDAAAPLYGSSSDAARALLRQLGETLAERGMMERIARAEDRTAERVEDAERRAEERLAAWKARRDERERERERERREGGGGEGAGLGIGPASANAGR